MTSHLRRLATLAAAGALLLTAGCSSQDEPKSPSAATATPTPEVTTEAPTDAPTPEEESSAQAGDADSGGTFTEEEAAAVKEAQEAIAEFGYADGADPASCQAVFGDAEDSVMTMFLASQSLADADETVAFVAETVERVEDIAAGAPAELAEPLQLLGDALELSATFEGQSQMDEIMADTEAAMTAAGEYCFGA